MPGLTAVSGAPDRAVDEALDAALFFDRYERVDVEAGDGRRLAHTGYDEYPVRRFDLGGHTALLEGYLYGTDDVEGAVDEVVDRLLAGDDAGVGEWVAARDGDFLLVVADDDGVHAVNDALGRLPTYRATVGDATVVTRELKVIRELARRLAGGLRPDDLGVAQGLLFGYPLGTRTLYEGVRQLPPGSRLTDGEVASVHDFDVARHDRADVCVETNAAALRKRFVEACENRAAAVDETVVSLSGGLDSRAVAAGYAHVDAPVVAATSANAGGDNAGEVDVAREVARTLDLEWESYVASASDRHREAILETTQGMNSLGMALGVDFVEQVAREHPGAMLVTGDGGHKALWDLTASVTLADGEDLLEAVLDGHRVFDVADVVDLVGVDRGDLLDSIRDRLAGYPESDPQAKYVRFQVRERAINYQNHGEDRTRAYLWSTSPLYALPFFDAALACPPEQKRHTRLFREFLTALSPEAVGVEYVDFGAPIDSLEYRLKKRVFDALVERPALKSAVFGLVGAGGDGDADVARTLSRTVDTDAADAPFSSEAVQRVSWGSDYSAEHRYVLFTLLAALDEERTTEAAPTA